MTDVGTLAVLFLVITLAALGFPETAVGNGPDGFAIGAEQFVFDIECFEHAEPQEIAPDNFEVIGAVDIAGKLQDEVFKSVDLTGDFLGLRKRIEEGDAKNIGVEHARTIEQDIEIEPLGWCTPEQGFITGTARLYEIAVPDGVLLVVLFGVNQERETAYGGRGVIRIAISLDVHFFVLVEIEHNPWFTVAASGAVVPAPVAYIP